jgi:YHS domain-containing protein
MVWLRWVILIALCYCLYLLLRPRRKEGQARGQSMDTPQGGIMVQDPWCKTYLPQDQALDAMMADKLLYFCSPKCRDQYLEKMRQEKP